MKKTGYLKLMVQNLKIGDSLSEFIKLSNHKNFSKEIKISIIELLEALSEDIENRPYLATP